MADDLDRLLDEVERRLWHRHGGGEEEPAAAKGRSAKVLLSAGSSEEDLDNIIDEICNDSSFTKTPPKLKSNSASLTPERNSVVVQAHGKRCCPVYLGGSLSPSGIGTNISKRTCDHLRCTACDFRVSLFNDYVWDQSCDYLFFRNNMPELSKLRAKMIKKKGARAYACQCSWRSIEELTDLQTEQQLRTCTGPAVCLGSLAVLLQCTRLLLPVPTQPCCRVRVTCYKPLQSPWMKRMQRKFCTEDIL
ncbi:cilia- and flagella-associated protein 418 isoform X4 [Vidua chalybeata]|uniref:cilia- and flagella-associated protein 418 isoform X4 n=1 Tax=Vidua chalybeata TaxID=81927 RepID=UPI0023A82287|nr:cilia- and flagella-associated protein 418 isoform X4 [Vidua chalybeata]